MEFKDGLFTPQKDTYDIGWNTLVLENHDNPRCVNRFSIDTKRYRYEAATFLATVTYMGFGIPYIYMGQEIGMTNNDFRNIDEMKDPVSHFVYDLLCQYHVPKKLAFSFIKYGARDHARIPVAWDDSINGGFNEGHEPWQTRDNGYKHVNVKKDLESERSVYRFYQKLLDLKKNDDAAIYGRTVEYDHENKRIVAYAREYEDERLFIAGNFSRRKTTYRLPEWLDDPEILLDNYGDTEIKDNTVTLEPYQALVLR